MEAKELRIGNLVRINNETWEEYNHIPMEVIGFSQKKDTYSINLELAFEEDFLNNGFSQFERFVEPIELTEEWLLKFGFMEINSKYYILNIEGFVIRVYYTSSGGDWFIHLEDIRLPFCNVHSLQNLYFALTGEELTINNDTN